MFDIDILFYEVLYYRISLCMVECQKRPVFRLVPTQSTRVSPRECCINSTVHPDMSSVPSSPFPRRRLEWNDRPKSNSIRRPVSTSREGTDTWSLVGLVDNRSQGTGVPREVSRRLLYRRPK